MLQSPETAAEHARIRAERDRYRTAWRMARTRALSAGGAADRYAGYARAGQEALQNMLFTVIAAQIARNVAVDEAAELRARIAELETERHTTNEALSDAAERLRADRDRIAELEKLLTAKARPADEDPVAYAMTDKAAPCTGHAPGYDDGMCPAHHAATTGGVS
jgi:hypothetical protein